MSPVSNWYNYHQFREQKAIEQVNNRNMGKIRWVMRVFQRSMYHIFHALKPWVNQETDANQPA